MTFVNGSYVNSSGCVPINLWNDSMIVGNTSMVPCIRDYSQKRLLKAIFSNILSGLIAFVMVGIGCAIEGKKILKHIKKPTGVISGLLCQFGEYLAYRQ